MKWLERFNKIINGHDWQAEVTGPEDLKLVKSFAKKHEFSYNNGLFNTEHLPPLISWSDEPLIEHDIHGTVAKHTSTIFRHRNLMQGIDYQQWVMHCKLTKEQPGFIVNGKASSYLPKHFTDFENLKLEGKFPERFEVYIPTNEQIDVMSVLAPDFMWRLYEKHESLDIIIAGNNLWLILGEERPITKVLNQLFDAAKEVLPELDR